MIRKHNYYQLLPANKYNPLAWIAKGAVIGDNCWIGSDVVITAGVTIGDNVSVACGAKLYDHDTSFNRVTEGIVPVQHNKITIGSNTQIGSNSVIITGNKDIDIGSNCIVGALCMVNKSFPSHTIITGIPARISGNVPMIRKEELKK